MTEKNSFGDPLDALRTAVKAMNRVTTLAARYSAPDWIPALDVATDNCRVVGTDVTGAGLWDSVPVAEIAGSGERAAGLCALITMCDPHAVQAVAAAFGRLLRLHRPAEPPRADWCAICGEGGQNMDCTFPCDTLRILTVAARALLRLDEHEHGDPSAEE